ncbi:MAG: phage tail tape measure protein, partial [Candidatus Onthovivens sp.]
MAEDITLKVVTETKGLQEKINSSSLSKEDKSVLSAKLSEALNLLSKGANASARDLSIAGGNIRKIVDELVKASAGAKGVSKELIKAQKSLEEATKARDALRKERSNITKTKINNEGKLRTSEANRLAIAANVTNDRGEAIKSYQALVTAANKGNVAAKEALENITRTFESYQTRLNELNTTAIPNADQAVKAAAEQVAKVEQDSPESSASVQMQEFGNELQNLIDKLKQMQSEAPDNSGGGGNKPNDVGVDPGDDLKKLGQNTTQTSTSLGRAFKQFSIYAIALRSIKKAAHEAVSTIKELDRSLTEQAMVTGKTRKQTYALLSSYQELAAQTGATTREVAGLATQFMRQGKTTQDALTLTKAAMDAAKVAGISASDSVNYLTTALNGFQMSAKDAMLVSDKFASIAANSATSYDEIATALSKVASQANLAGMSIDYTTALLAKGLETTREAPETMGTALKTVIARMREISDYGETLGGDTDVNNVESQLAYVGIALRDANGELRSTEEVLDELGKKWDVLNSNQQAAVAKALAGTRQQSRLIAMMTDYERVIELQQISERSAGATLAQMETYLEGMDAALNKVNVAWESIVTNLVNNEFIISLVNGFSSVLNIIGRIFSTTSTLAPVMALMVMYATSLGAKKLEEYKIAKLQQKIDKEKRINELKAFIETRKQTLER